MTPGSFRGPVLGAVVSTGAPSVALTFDDGPDPRFTPDLLEVLSGHGVRATFFVLLTKVRRHPELLQAVVAAGHEVGLHGPDHRPLPTFGFAEASRRLRSAADELAEVTGRRPRLYRPPYGAQTARSFAATLRADLEPVLWSATTWDWKEVTPSQRLTKAIDGAVPGSILLAHDGAIDHHDGAPDEPIVDCDRPALIDEVLGRLGDRQVPTATVGDAIGQGGAVRTLRFLRPRWVRPGHR